MQLLPEISRNPAKAILLVVTIICELERDFLAIDTSDNASFARHNNLGIFAYAKTRLGAAIETVNII